MNTATKPCFRENEPRLKDVLREVPKPQLDIQKVAQSPLEKVLASKTISEEAKYVFAAGWYAGKAAQR